MAMTQHAVVGTGEAPKRVVIEGLTDIVKSGDCVALIWRGKPNDTTEVVYDYVLDNEVNFVMYYEEGTTPPRVFREADHGLVQKVRNSVKAAVQSVEGKGAVLFLWDDEDEDSQVDPVFDFKSAGTLVLALTNGLAPITDESEIPEPTDPVLPEDPDEPEDDSRFSKEELENMAAAAVKRYGERIKAKATTKSGIIAELFPEPLVKEHDPELEALLAEIAQRSAGTVVNTTIVHDGIDPLSARLAVVEEFLRNTFSGFTG